MQTMETVKEYKGQYRKVGGKCSDKHRRAFFKWFDEQFNLNRVK